MSYYIYQLIDPRDGKPFYIGKGKDRRIDAHEKEAKRGVYSRKCSRIREIWESGHQVEKQIIKKFGDELKAYDAEKALIEQIGLENLTNVVPGGVPQKPREVREKEDRLTLVDLRKFAPTLAQTLRMLDGGKRLLLGQTDITKAFDAFLSRMVKELGAQAVIDAVKPHGVELQLRKEVA